MSQKSKWDYLKAIYSRYRKVSKPLRARILDEFSARLAATTANTPSGCSTVQRHKNPRQTPKAVAHLWPESHLVSYGHLGGGRLSVLGAPQSSPTVMAPLGPKAIRYLGPSPKAAALDQPRYHRPAAQAQKTPTQNRLYGRTKPGTLLKHHIPIKTDSWDVKTPGFTETDLVSHSGNSASGEFIHSLNVTDIHSTWVTSRALMGKSQIAVLNALQEIEQALPFKLLGIDSDNGSEFINYHLKTFCDQ